MALGACRECDHQVSSEADTCPRCGCPRPYPKGVQQAQSDAVTSEIFEQHQDANSNRPSPKEATTPRTSGGRFFTFVLEGFIGHWLKFPYYLMLFRMYSRVSKGYELGGIDWTIICVGTFLYLCSWFNAFVRNYGSDN